MRQLFQNLIGNALKFHRADEPPLVKVSVQSPNGHGGYPAGADANERCQIMIEDNGIGFDEKYCDRIFAMFQRLHGRHEYEGTGIGLAVCQKIAKRHGGSVTARSTLGKGSTFIVTLPIRQLRGEPLEE
jgi:signal transduction histidine kinase